MASAETAQPVSSTHQLPVRLSHLWQIPVLLLALMAWGVFLWHGRDQYVSQAPTADELLQSIRRDFRERQYDRVRSQSLLFVKAFAGSESASEVNLLAGRAAVEQIKDEPVRAEELYRQAIIDLSLALTGKLSEEDAVIARRNLAECYLGCQQLDDARQVIEELHKSGSPATGDLLLSLAVACFDRNDVVHGEETIRKVLEDVNEEESKVSILLVLAEGLRKDKASERARQVLDEILREHPRTARLKEVHFCLAQVLYDQGELEPAQESFDYVWQKLEPRDVVLDRAAKFLAGRCLEELQRLGPAETVLREVEKENPGTDEAVAARLLLGKIYLASERFDEARAAVSGVLADLPEGNRLANRYVTDIQLREVWKGVLDNFLSRSAFQEAQILIQEAQKLGDRDGLLITEGMTYQEEADRQSQLCERMLSEGRLSDAREAEGRADQLHLKAAAVFLKVVHSLSQDADPQVYQQALWRAAENLYVGKDYVRAVTYYRMLVDSKTAPAQQGQAMLRLGQALAALGRHGEAIQKFQWVTVDAQVSNMLYAYEALYAMGKSYLALGELESARKKFEEIVEGDGETRRFSPKADIWMRSLPLLGYVCYRLGDYASAAEKLDEALQRGLSKTDQTLPEMEVRFYLAESLRLLPETSDRRSENLRYAGECYDRFLAEVQEVPQPDQRLKEMQQSAYFNRAQCLFDRHCYGPAAEAYREASERYLEQPCAVTALYRWSVCCRQLGQFERAQEVLDRARWSARQMQDKSAIPPGALLDAREQVLTGREGTQ